MFRDDTLTKISESCSIYIILEGRCGVSEADYRQQKLLVLVTAGVALS